MTVNQDYELWMSEVNKHVYELLEVSVHDLEDWLSMDAFIDGMDPMEAALEAIANDDLASRIYDELYG